MLESEADQYFVYKSYRFLSMIGAVGLEDFYPVSILRIFTESVAN